MNGRMSKRLKEAAEKLAGMTEPVVITRIGSEAKKLMGDNITDQDGKPLNDGNWYKFTVEQDVNHHDKMKDIYTRKGLDGCLKYTSLVHRHHTDKKKNLKTQFELVKSPGVRIKVA